MKRRPADPSHARGEELRDDAARWRSATFGSRLGGPRLTFRPPRHTNDRPGFGYLQGDGGIRPLFAYLAVVVVVLAVAALVSIGQWAQSAGPEEPEALQARFVNGPVTCHWIEGGSVRFSTTVDLDSQVAFVREQALAVGVVVEWRLDAGGQRVRTFREFTSVTEDGVVEQVLGNGLPRNGTCSATVHVFDTRSRNEFLERSS